MTFTFTIKGRLDSLNRTLKAPRWRFTQSRRRAEVLYHVGQYIMIARIPKFTTPVRVHVKWIEPNQRRDRDNIRSGVKPILDALVEQERIVNDSQKWLTELTDSYAVDPENPRIEVTISSNEPGTQAAYETNPK